MAEPSLGRGSAGEGSGVAVDPSGAAVPQLPDPPRPSPTRAEGADTPCRMRPPAGMVGSDKDIDMPVGDLELGPAQGEAFATRMAAGPQIELPAMPWADDILALWVVLKHPGFAVLVHRLADLLVDAALTHRPATMGALIVPRDQLAIDVEDADFGAVAGNHAPLSLDQFVNPSNHEGFHSSFIPVQVPSEFESYQGRSGGQRWYLS